MITKHSELTQEQLHALPSYVFVDIAARDAHVYVQEDVDKLVRVDTPLEYYLITDVVLGVATFKSLTSLIQTTFLANNTVVGTTPTLIASWQLPANTYTPPKALFGCGDPTHTATLQLKKQDGTLLISFTAQGVDWHTAPLGFTLATEQMVDLVLFSDHTSAAAFIHSFTF